MIRSLRLPILVALSLAACGDDGGSGPTRLYLALLDSELTVQLTEREPNPY
jgi:hypothetical protein